MSEGMLKGVCYLPKGDGRIVPESAVDSTTFFMRSGLTHVVICTGETSLEILRDWMNDMPKGQNLTLRTILFGGHHWSIVSLEGVALSILEVNSSDHECRLLPIRPKIDYNNDTSEIFPFWGKNFRFLTFVQKDST